MPTPRDLTMNIKVVVDTSELEAAIEKLDVLRETPHNKRCREESSSPAPCTDPLTSDR